MRLQKGGIPWEFVRALAGEPYCSWSAFNNALRPADDERHMMPIAVIGWPRSWCQVCWLSLIPERDML